MFPRWFAVPLYSALTGPFLRARNDQGEIRAGEEGDDLRTPNLIRLSHFPR